MILKIETGIGWRSRFTRGRESRMLRPRSWMAKFPPLRYIQNKLNCNVRVRKFCIHLIAKTLRNNLSQLKAVNCCMEKVVGAASRHQDQEALGRPGRLSRFLRRFRPHRICLTVVV